MAIRYYDTTPAANGFGALSTNYGSPSLWTGSVWSSSSQGTSGTNTTFVSGDDVNFGSATNSLAGGYVGLGGSTYSVASLTVQNMVAGAGAWVDMQNGTLSFSGGSITLSNPIYLTIGLSGTAIKAGTAELNLRPSASGTYSSGLTSLTVNDGTVGLASNIGAGSTNTFFTNSATITITAGKLVYAEPYYTSNTVTYACNFAGAGLFSVRGSQLGFVPSITGTLTGLTGYSVASLADVRGLQLWANAGSAGFTTAATTLPRQLTFYTQSSSPLRLNLTNSTAAANYQTTLVFVNATASATYTARLSTASSAEAFTIGDATNGSFVVPSFGTAATATITLQGTNTGLNTVNGNATVSVGTLALRKEDAGTWVLGGNNSALASTTVAGGTLRGTNNNAFGGNVTMSAASTVLELANNITVSNTTAVNALGTVRNVSGNNTLSGDLTLAGALTVEAQADSLTLSGLITGSTAFAKTGTGVATLSNTANSFTSSLSISAGTLAIPAIAALGAGSGLALSSSGVLRYTGSTGGTLSRAVTGTGLSGAGFDNTGAGSLAVTNATMDGTISLAASNSASQFNTLTATISSGGFTKTGDGRWIINKLNNLSGTTTVSAGTLMAAPEAAAPTQKLLGGSVTVAAGAKIQTSSDNSQLGRNNYTNLTFAGTVGTPARIRIGGSAVSPTVQMSGNLTISGAVTWKLTADVFKSPGTYRLVEFVSGALVGNITDVTVQLPTGRTLGSLAYDGASSPKTITVTVN